VKHNKALFRMLLPQQPLLLLLLLATER